MVEAPPPIAGRVEEGRITTTERYGRRVLRKERRKEGYIGCEGRKEGRVERMERI